MDLRVYYQKLRELEATLPSDYVVVVSKETPDGGCAGTLTEVSRRLAAQLILDGAAELATEEQTRQWRSARMVAEAGGSHETARPEPTAFEEPTAKRGDLVRKK
ncbi:MAG: hypothetical protein RMK57_16210 [Bryobacterales bacterium]|nr:hypothetical protein [Bryobacteraceae bacterium]MDW8356067.1 hypothetical protein [Bryobacterales bacterium]